jgi:hypothetical protein
MFFPFSSRRLLASSLSFLVLVRSICSALYISPNLPSFKLCFRRSFPTRHSSYHQFPSSSGRALLLARETTRPCTGVSFG